MTACKIFKAIAIEAIVSKNMNTRNRKFFMQKQQVNERIIEKKTTKWTKTNGLKKNYQNLNIAQRQSRLADYLNEQIEETLEL